MKSAVEGSRPLAATYYVAPSPHLGIEPLTATARFDGHRLEVWAPTQAPGLAREAAARAAGIGASHVALYPMPVGAPSGRAFEADAIPYRGRAGATLGRAGAASPCRKARARTTTSCPRARLRE